MSNNFELSIEPKYACLSKPQLKLDSSSPSNFQIDTFSPVFRPHAQNKHKAGDHRD